MQQGRADTRALPPRRRSDIDSESKSPKNPVAEGRGRRPRKRNASTCSGNAIVVVNLLPVKIKRSAGGGGWEAEWDFDKSTPTTSVSVCLRNIPGIGRTTFVGSLDVFVTPDEEEAVTICLQKLGCVPVFLDKEMAHRYYQGYCRGTLWPVMHNVVDVYNKKEVALPTQDHHTASSGAASDGHPRP